MSAEQVAPTDIGSDVYAVNDTTVTATPRPIDVPVGGLLSLRAGGRTAVVQLGGGTTASQLAAVINAHVPSVTATIAPPPDNIPSVSYPQRSEGTYSMSRSVSISVDTTAWCEALNRVTGATRRFGEVATATGSMTSSFMRNVVEAARRREEEVVRATFLRPQSVPVFNNDFSTTPPTPGNLQRVIDRMRYPSAVTFPVDVTELLPQQRHVVDEVSVIAQQAVRRQIGQNIRCDPASGAITDAAASEIEVAINDVLRQCLFGDVCFRINRSSSLMYRGELDGDLVGMVNEVREPIRVRNATLMFIDDLIETPTPSQQQVVAPTVIHYQIDAVEVSLDVHDDTMMSRLLPWLGEEVRLGKALEEGSELDIFADEVEATGLYLVYVSSRKTLRVATESELTAAGSDFKRF